MQPRADMITRHLSVAFRNDICRSHNTRGSAYGHTSLNNRAQPDIQIELFRRIRYRLTTLMTFLSRPVSPVYSETRAHDQGKCAIRPWTISGTGIWVLVERFEYRAYDFTTFR